MYRTFLAGCLTILLWPMPATSANVDHAQVDSFLVLAADTTVSYKDRVKLIKKAIKLDDTGRAMFALGELYLDGSTISSRRDASLWLQRAMRKDKKNLDYRIAYARYLSLIHI